MDELTIAFKIESPPSWLPIGRTAENNWRAVEIDCSYWFNMSADGEVVLMYKPSCGMSSYPLLTERDGDNIIWRPKSGELVEGVGRLQAFFEVGTDVIGSSDMISCEVDSSLLGADPGTDPGQTDLPWALDIIEQIAELSGHYPKIIDGVLYIWDSTLNEWVEFEAGGSSSGAVESVNGQTGAVVLDASDVGALPSTYTAPVQSVNGKTGAVTLTASDVNALPDSTVIPTVPAMATDPDMTDWDTGKIVDAAVLKSGFTLVGNVLSRKANVSDIPTAVSDLTNDSGYQTASDVQTAIANAAELPTVTASDNGKFLRVVNGAWAAQAVPSAESNSFGGGA